MNPKNIVRLVITLAVVAGAWSCSFIQDSGTSGSAARTSPFQDVVILSPQQASFLETLGAREVRRYVYQRTGKLLPVIQVDEIDASVRNAVIVASKNRLLVKSSQPAPATESLLTSLEPGHYSLQTIHRDGWKIVLIAGGDPLGTLYGAYRFAEHLGVGFYLHGDTIPDERMVLHLPDLDEHGTPLFAVRGILPFHDFPEGPDWWNVDDYKAILSQLPKLRMNFIGLHTYPERRPGNQPAAEPTVWIGLPDDVDKDGKVHFSYPASYQNTLRGNFGYRAKKTDDFVFGAAALFERDAYGPVVMNDCLPEPETLQACNELFNRTGDMLRQAFRYARLLGIKTCVGTEIPLPIPEPVKKRLEDLGKVPSDPATVQELYEGIFLRAARTHPLDYYWLWTPEAWTWQGSSEEEIQETTADLQMAIAAAEGINAPFELATCGWVLGPQGNRAMFSRILPANITMSCINRFAGKAPVDPAFEDLGERPKWAIPWLEDDSAFCCPQLWAGRMRRDAGDALKYGCTGLIGIHWRTRILGPNVSSLAHAAWDQSGWGNVVKEQPTSATEEGPLGGVFASYTGTPIAGTDDDPLYQTVRYDFAGYRLSVPDGTYKVTLKFCEPHFTEKGKRVFGIRIQDREVINRLDIFAEAGVTTAFDCTFENIHVTGGQLEIQFIRQIGNPCIAGIVVEGEQLSRKINCGGPAYKDYAPDWPPFDGKPRDLPADDFYQDWALRQFGPEVAERIAEIFTSIDGKFPETFVWTDGPGGLRPDARPWNQVRTEYAFVERLAALRPHVKGADQLERFDYWLNQFRHAKAAARVRCTWARYNQAMEKVKAEEDPDTQKQLAKETALPLRIQLLRQVARAYRYLLATVTTTAEMGTVANWEQHILPGLLETPGEELAQILGEPLPADALPSKQYTGTPRVVVPTVRTSIMNGEILSLKVLILDREPPRSTLLFWREMGCGSFSAVALSHVARGVYSVSLPRDAARGMGIEYYVRVERNAGELLYFPVTAPALNQTVVIVEEPASG